jgi:hypothetical protein
LRYPQVEAPSAMFPIPRNTELALDLLTFSVMQNVITTWSRISKLRLPSTSFAGDMSEVGGTVFVLVTRLRLVNFAIGAMSFAPSWDNWCLYGPSVGEIPRHKTNVPQCTVHHLSSSK